MTERIRNFLQKFLKTDMDYLIKGGFWLTLSKILAMVATFASSVAFANLLPESTYGMFRYVLSVTSLLSIPTLQGIHTAIAQSIARGDNPGYKKALQTQMKWGSLGMIAGLALAGYYLYAGDDTLALVFLIVSMFIPFMDPFHIYAGILHGQKKFNILARDETVTRTGATILIIAAVFFTEHIIPIILSYFVSTTILRYAFLKLSTRDFDEHDENNTEFISYGKHLSVMRIFGRLSTQADKILLFQQFGATTLAIFYLAFVPFKYAQTFLKGLSILALPKFSTNTVENLRASLPKKVAKLYLIIVPCIITYIFIAPYLFQIFYPKYLESIFASQILILQLLFFPFSLFGTAMISHAQKRNLYTISIIYNSARIGLLLILVPLFGIFGVIATILSTGALSAGLTTYLFYRGKHDT